MRGACVVAVAVTLAGALLAACGGDGDDQAGTGQAKQQPNAAAAQRLETYLKKNTKDLKASHGSGEAISFVEPADGKLKVWTNFNADLPDEERLGVRVCRVAKRSGVPEADGAIVVDAGDVGLQRC